MHVHRWSAVIEKDNPTQIKERETMLKRMTGVGVLLALAAVSAYAQQAAPQAPKTHLKVGDVAPDFSLPGTDGKTYKLSDFRGRKNVVLAFYVLAFTGG